MSRFPFAPILAACCLWAFDAPADTQSAAIKPSTVVDGETGITIPEPSPLEAITLPGIMLPATFERYNNLSAFGYPCGAQIDVIAQPDAMMRVEIADPCRASERIHVHHAGLTFSAKLSMFGRANFNIPALATHASLRVRFQNGSDMTTSLLVTDADQFVRTALQFDSRSRAKLVPSSRTKGQVMEFGGLGGTEDQSLSIFSKAATATDGSAVVRLMIESKITAQTCWTGWSGKVLQVAGTEPPIRYDLAVEPVDCARIGETLELNNIVPDLKLAVN